MKWELREGPDDCGQDVCATPPGCHHHWGEQVREVMAERDAAIAERDRLAARLAAVREVIAGADCDCPCASEHGSDHADECERCLGCRVDAALKRGAR
jgi:hypothetical protein